MGSHTLQPNAGNSSQIVVAQNVRHQAGKATKENDSDNVESVGDQILATITQLNDEKMVRTRFAKELANLNGAIGVCYLAKRDDDLWQPDRRLPTFGRLPDVESFANECSEKCDEFVRSPNVQRMPISSVGGLTGLFIPIRPKDSAAEIILVIIRKNIDAAHAIPVAQRIGAAFNLWLNGRNSADSSWQVETLASINELLALTHQQPNFQAACEEVTNQLANRLDCETVALGTFQRGRIRLRAISGVPKFDRGSQSSKAYRQAIIESCTRKEPGVYPTHDPEANFLLQSHKQLVASTQDECVFSQPLIDLTDGELVGALVFTGKRNQLDTTQFARYALTASPGIASSLGLMKVLTPGPWAKLSTFVGKISPSKKLLVFFTLLCLVALMFLPTTYRVRCNCIVEPVSRRFAVAPFEGQIIAGHAEPGDIVSKGQVLAEMDGRTIRWELAGVSAKRNQSMLSRGKELAERNVAETLMAELEYDRLIAEQNVLEFKKDHLLIKSPVDGIVLSGSLERAEAASVKIGQTLFEVGPLTPLQIEIAIPSEDVLQVKVGYPVTVWIEGQDNISVEGKIVKIHPMSEVRDADNIFVAKIEFANEDLQLRPGMKGLARIDCTKQTLGWCLFHKPVNWLKARFVWW